MLFSTDIGFLVFLFSLMFAPFCVVGMADEVRQDRNVLSCIEKGGEVEACRDTFKD